MGEIARVLVTGDWHLSSRNYGNHKDYPSESIKNLQKVVDVAEELNITHHINAGDMTYGRFTTLEYRALVEERLNEINKLTSGNNFMIKGNHDSATNGMTEYEFYLSKGIIKDTRYIDIGNLHITMYDNGHIGEYKPTIKSDGTNLVICHDYVKFKDTMLPNFGTAIELDNMADWYGVDFILCGHIHKLIKFVGKISNGTSVRTTGVAYLGCMNRPSYNDDLDTYSENFLITVYDDGRAPSLETIKIELDSIEDTFTIDKIEENREKKEEKENRTDIRDILHQLNQADKTIGNPEDIIASMVGVDERYKKKAIELLKEA